MDLDLVMNILIGSLGILFLTVFNAKEYIFKKDLQFSWTTHGLQNYHRWLWALFMVSIIAVITRMEPETASGIKAFTGLDIAETRASFFSLGLALTAMIKKKSV